jgi:pyruvate formate lyase activating enzyme
MFYKKSELFKKEGKGIRCLACNFKCLIPDNSYGRCRVRYNKNGELFVPFNYLSSVGLDPIEKKPVYHFLPGSLTFSFGMYGCNFRCKCCQNWEISQEIGQKYLITSDEIIKKAIDNNINVFVSTYNEPTITVEWALEIFSKAKENIKDSKTGFVSNGYISKESLDYLDRKIDFIRVDLKSFNKEKYRELTGGADLDKLLSSIEEIYKRSIHLELVTLVIEDFNDSDDEIKSMAYYIKSLSPSIPWHLTRFHPAYKMTENKQTSTTKIERLIDIAKQVGVFYVYGGNYITKNLNTYCPSCRKLIIERSYMSLERNYLSIKNGKGFCPWCGFEIYGVF